jgi:hypothetical protein
VKGGLCDRLAFCLPVYPPIVDRQLLGKHVPVAANTSATVEELLNAVFSMRSVSYQIVSM